MGKHQSKFGFNDAAKSSNGLPGMICFPARLRRANSVDSFMVPLLPTAQSMMSVASTNGRSLSLESIPLVDTVPLLRVPEQPSRLASNCLTHSTKNNEQSDANTNISSTSSTDSTLSEETEKKDTVSTVQGSIQGSQNDSPFFNLSEQEWKEVVDFVCSRVHCTLRKALLEFRTHQKQHSSAKPTSADKSKDNERNRTGTQRKRSHRKLQMDDNEMKRFDDLLQQRLQQISHSCFQDSKDKTSHDTRTHKRTTNHHFSAPLTPHLPRRKGLRLSARSKSEEDTSRCGRQSDDDFQSRLEEIAKQCDSRGIRGKGVAMTGPQNSDQHKFTPKKQKRGPRKGHSKSLADIDNNAPGINRIHESRQKISRKSHSMGRDYARKYPNGRPFVQHREAEIQPITDTVQVQQEVHYYHKHFEVEESTTKMMSLQSTEVFAHPHAGAHHDCSCHPIHSGRMSPQTDMAVFNLDVSRLDNQRLVRHWHRHDHHHYHIVHVAKRTQV